MNFLEQYLQRSEEIIGDRSPAEKRYDNEVLKKYPREALDVDDSNSDDVASHYLRL